MAAPYSFVVCDDNTRKTYDARVKNKFKWEWLTEKDTHGDFLCRRIGLVLFLSKRSELQQYAYSGKACFISYASKSKVDQRERRLNKTNHQLPDAIQATQDIIPWSVKHQMPLLWIGPKYIDLDLDSRSGSPLEWR